MRPLNNFATELVAVDVSGHREETFILPRKGWVFLSCTAMIPSNGRVRIGLDPHGTNDAILDMAASGPSVRETMRLLEKGSHTLAIACENASAQIVVRSIPEMIFSRMGYHPHIRPYGPYDWAFLEKNGILDHITTLSVNAGAAIPDEVRQGWMDRGRRWIGYINAPGLRNPEDAPKSYGTWSQALKNGPHLSALISDEFYPRVEAQFTFWTDALQRMRKEGILNERKFYAYVAGDMWAHKHTRDFAQLLMDGDDRLVWEVYLLEKTTEAEARQYLERQFIQRMLAWQRVQPGVENHMIIALSVLSSPPALLQNTNPGVDFKVWMDMQVQALATHPVFAGIQGLMWWTSGYATEETVRWEAKLFRHYCIEGNTERLSSDPYELPHLINPDFALGRHGWEIQAAEQDSVQVRSHERYGEMAGRRWSTREGELPGDTFLWMRRSSQGPNTCAQEIRALEPGRLYSLKMLVGDYRDLVENRSGEGPLGLRIDIQGAEEDRARGFDFQFRTRQLRDDYHLTYIWRIFRATAPTAKLVLSDAVPDAPSGRELAINFIELQPYLEHAP